eukprot:84563-Prorocentrum_minimum.AAC.1
MQLQALALLRFSGQYSVWEVKRFGKAAEDFRRVFPRLFQVACLGASGVNSSTGGVISGASG